MMVRSPESAQTYADNSLLWHQLRWMPSSGTLVATITLSNRNYVSDIEPRHDETFTFSLPGVKFDPSNEVFYIPGPHNSRIPVAALHHEFLGKRVKLLPGTSIVVTKRSGLLTVRLVANQKTDVGNCWLER